MSDKCAKCGTEVGPDCNNLGRIVELADGYALGKQARNILNKGMYKPEDKLCGVDCFWRA